MKWSLLLFSIRFIFVNQEINHRPPPFFLLRNTERISDLDASFDSMMGCEYLEVPPRHMDHLALELQYQGESGVGHCFLWIISENWNPLLSILLHHYSTVSSGNILNLFLFTRIFFPKIVNVNPCFRDSNSCDLLSLLGEDQMTGGTGLLLLRGEKGNIRKQGL